MLFALLAAELTDAQLIARATAPFEKAAKENKHEVLGRWHGRAILADYPCSDVCPDYTVRVVRLNVTDAACVAAGGRSVLEDVPISIAVVQRRFCVPAPLATPALLLRSRSGR